MIKLNRHIIWWVVSIFALLLLFIIVRSYNANRKCKDLVITVDTNNQYSVLSEEDLLAQINATAEPIVGQKNKDLDLEFLESMLEDNIYVRDADVFLNIDGVVEVNIQQRRPLVRLTNTYNETYFLDDFGRIMPLSPDHASRVIVANGYIPENQEEILEIDKDMEEYPDSLQQLNMHYKIYSLARYIEQDEFLNALIAQIYINKEGQFELVPLVGDHIIVLDDPLDNIDIKCENLKIFYDQGLPKMGWDRYKMIDISIENQVICTLRDSLI